MAGSGTAHLRDAGDTLLRVENLVVEFPVGPTGRKVHAVSDVSIDVARGRDPRPRRRVGLRQVDHRPGHHAAAAAHRRVGRLRGPGPHRARQGRAAPASRPELQMIFQDPISSLNPRRKVGDIVAEPLHIWKRRHARRAQAPRSRRDARGRRPRPRRRRGPAAPPVLRRPVPAHLHRPRAGARPQAHHLRRAGVGPRRVGAGPDPQPARGHEGALRADPGVHRPRPGRREERQRPGGGHVPRASCARSASPTTLYAEPAHPYTAALLGLDPGARPHGAADRRAAPSSGELPSPIDPPSGCRFRTRCPPAQERCAAEEPKMRAGRRGPLRRLPLPARRAGRDPRRCRPRRGAVLEPPPQMAGTLVSAARQQYQAATLR